MAERPTGTPIEPGVLARVARGFRALASSVRGDGDFFGPGHALQVEVPKGQERALDYPAFYNVGLRPVRDTGTTFADLRALADNCDLVRMAIETRKDQMCRLQWDVRRRDDLSDDDPRAKRIRKVLRKPDGENRWSTWLRMMLEEIWVIDAAVMLPQKTRGGSILGLELIDGSTITRKLALDGRTPRPTDEDPIAYQQIIKGVPIASWTSDQLLYFVRNKRVSKVYGFSPVEQVLMTVNIALRRQIHQLEYYCYSDDTEVMTKSGWRRFEDCGPEEEFATRQIGTGRFEWQQAYDTFRKPYVGPMISFTGRSLDMLVTPNHRMLVNSLPRGLGENRANLRSSEHVITAEELMVHGTRNTGIPLTSRWEGAEIGEREFRDSDPRSKAVVMSGDDYCAFMGMYLAEGNLHHKGSIAISQPPDDRGAHKTYKELLDRIFPTGVCYSGHQFEVCRKSLATFLRQFGKAADKFIPEDIRGATPRQIAIFLRYYWLGDGRAAGDDGIGTQQAYTVSRQLADDLTEVGQKAGYAPSVWIRRASDNGTVAGRRVRARQGYLVSFAKMAATKGWHASVVDYDGPVACVCVPNKFLYVRRNGKAAWSGNTEGNIPEALCGVPPEWSPENIKEFQEHWDSLLAGETGKRRHMKFVPGDIAKNYKPMREPVIKDEYDEWLARVVMYAFSLAPTAFIQQNNRATADSSSTTGKEEGLEPTKTFVKEIMDEAIEVLFDSPDLEFSWRYEASVDRQKQAAIHATYIETGILSPNEARREIGLQPRDGGEKYAEEIQQEAEVEKNRIRANASDPAASTT